MAQTKTPTAREARQGSAHVCLAVNRADSTTLAPDIQDHLDVVAILAARSRVHPATVAAHLAAFGIGEARS